MGSLFPNGREVPLSFSLVLAVLHLMTASASADVLSLAGEKSLARLEVELSAKSDPSQVEIFSLGAVQFLGAVERSLQKRYESNAAVGAEWLPVPLLRLPFEPNPNPEPFRPEVIRELFEKLAEDMDTARTTLQRAELGPGDGVRVDLTKVWFDIDDDGARGNDEGLLAIIAGTLADPRLLELQISPNASGMNVQFDAADVEWFIAYTHFLSAVSEFVIAFDPTESLPRLTERRDAMVKLRSYEGS